MIEIIIPCKSAISSHLTQFCGILLWKYLRVSQIILKKDLELQYHKHNMGLFIPPSSGGDNNDPNKSGSDGKKSNSKEDGVITLPNPSNLLPTNPSIGLRIWGPLVPASDNRIGLLMLTGLQFGIGLLGFNKARQLRASKLPYNVPNTISRRASKWMYALVGSYLIFQSGLEMTRITLPYDPWFDEAKYYRKLATRNGDVPSWWFGAYKYFKPMTFKDWNNKMEKWLNNSAVAISAMEEKSDQNSGFFKINISNKPSHSPVLAKLAEKGRYIDIHQNLQKSNLDRYRELLAGDLKNVIELNKAERLDRILEEKGDVKYNPDYTKPHIQLGNHKMESDEDFEIVWLNFEPWEELKLETDYDIRLIPRWRWSNEDSIESEISTDTTLPNNQFENLKGEQTQNEEASHM